MVKISLPLYFVCSLVFFSSMIIVYFICTCEHIYELMLKANTRTVMEEIND